MVLSKNLDLAITCRYPSCSPTLMVREGTLSLRNCLPLSTLIFYIFYRSPTQTCPQPQFIVWDARGWGTPLSGQTRPLSSSSPRPHLGGAGVLLEYTFPDLGDQVDNLLQGPGLLYSTWIVPLRV